MPAAAAVLFFCSGCFLPLAGLTEGHVVRTEVGDFLLKWSPADTRDEARSERAIQHASSQLLRWGKLQRAVTFYLLPSHRRFEAAVRGFGYDWMHAWAQYDEVYFETPSAWEAADPDLDELVLHELTHCLMYQRSASATTWADKQIPLWFREGMATWTAKEGAKWATREDLARFYEKHPGADPIGRPEELYKEDTDIVYAAGQHAFEFLIERFGEPAVLRLMDAMSQGHTFPQAFEVAIGITAAAFVNEFRRDVLTKH